MIGWFRDHLPGAIFKICDGPQAMPNAKRNKSRLSALSGCDFSGPVARSHICSLSCCKSSVAQQMENGLDGNQSFGGPSHVPDELEGATVHTGFPHFGCHILGRPLGSFGLAHENHTVRGGQTELLDVIRLLDLVVGNLGVGLLLTHVGHYLPQSLHGAIEQDLVIAASELQFHSPVRQILICLEDFP